MYINKKIVHVHQVDYIDLKDGQKHSLEKLKNGRYDIAVVALKQGLSTDVYVIGGLIASGATATVERQVYLYNTYVYL